MWPSDLIPAASIWCYYLKPQCVQSTRHRWESRGARRLLQTSRETSGDAERDCQPLNSHKQRRAGPDGVCLWVCVCVSEHLQRCFVSVRDKCPASVTAQDEKKKHRGARKSSAWPRATGGSSTSSGTSERAAEARADTPAQVTELRAAVPLLRHGSSLRPRLGVHGLPVLVLHAHTERVLLREAGGRPAVCATGGFLPQVTLAGGLFFPR